MYKDGTNMSSVYWSVRGIEKDGESIIFVDDMYDENPHKFRMALSKIAKDYGWIFTTRLMGKKGNQRLYIKRIS